LARSPPPHRAVGRVGRSLGIRDDWSWRRRSGLRDRSDAAYSACLRKTYQLASQWAVPIDRVGLFCWMQRPS
jgi:hypothetical protein